MNEPTARRAPGCVSMLGGPLLAFGLWMIAQALLLPHEAETVRLSVVTGAFAALLGGWLLAARLRRVFRQRPATSGAPPSSAPPSATSPSPAPADAAAGAGAGVEEARLLEGLSPGVGCLLVSLAFLLVGPVFLYFYFSGAPTRRGNPVMGLVFGVVFSLVGLVGVWALVSGRRQERRAARGRDSRRLP